MSTHDVPGTNPKNGDELAMGCWAEHEDGSLIFVESTEVGRVVYSIFDMSKTPPVEYRDAMPEASFKTQFSWKDGDDDEWTWHDKTPFDWDRVIRQGASDGPRTPSADQQLTAAERVANSLRLRAERATRDHSHRADQARGRIGEIWGRLETTMREFGDELRRRIDR